jgi:cyclopropane-fatty-acyl-phospholipid synthase
MTTRMPVAQALEHVLGLPIRIEAYDGSVAGPADATVKVTIRSSKALSHMVSAPGELGMARAYVSGEMDFDAPDHFTILKLVAGQKIGDLSWKQRIEVLKALGPEVIQWVEPPPQEVGAKRYLSGLRSHTKSRDAMAISHHYDVSNTFYEWVLGPSMAYTCACYPTADATLEEAQYNKFDLVCRKLALKPGMRLLDVGCGWGGMAMHAAKNYGVDVVAVTLSRQQAEWGQKAAADAGLSDSVDIRFQDYRDVPETGFDAISSIGLTEHIGIHQLPSYAFRLASKLAPQGRLLNHCITRPDDHSRRSPAAASSAATCSPTASCPVSAGWSRSSSARASSCSTRRTCGSTTPRRSTRGATTSTPTGTRRWPRWGRRRPGCGRSTWPAPGWPSSATTSSCTSCC